MSEDAADPPLSGAVDVEPLRPGHVPGEPPPDLPVRADELARVQEQLELAQRRNDELVRAYAEQVNDREAYRRRLERERERQLEGLRGDAAAVLLDTLDELERALKGHEASAPGPLADGVKLIVHALQHRMAALGLVRIPTSGRFDPRLHEAVDLAPSPDPEADGAIVEEVRAGYRLGERVVRAARVRVARHVAGPGAPEPPKAAAGPAGPGMDPEHGGAGRE